MNIFDDVTLLYKVAKYYYINDYSQHEIAKTLNFSRPQISRLLKRARELGIVQIEVSLPNTLDRRQLTQEIKKLFNLKNVIISPVVPNEKESDSGLYALAADYLHKALSNCKNIGVGWGKTLYHTALQLSYQEQHPEMTFYPLIGNSGNNNPYLQTSSITDRFAEKFRAKAYFSNSLAVMLKSNYTSVEQERVKKLRNAWANLDTAIIGLGGKNLLDKIYIDEISESAEFQKQIDHITGDILATFFLDDRTNLKYPENYYLEAIDLKTLQSLENVICIAGGPNKVDAICYAAESGYFKTLITDERTAKAILKKNDLFV
ncbi:MAG: sugar-binding transcriptional regulator [Bacillota bacterium]